DVSFLVGLEEGILPHSRSTGSEFDVEEERRLFYVGLTRARERAYLSIARRRALFGRFRDAVPSRFLSEIPPALLRWEGMLPPGEGAVRGAAGRPFRAGGGNESLRAKPQDPVPAGRGPGPAVRRSMRVRHPAFGEGNVEAVEGEGDNRKITACFPGYGRKTILVRLGKMEFLS
ncbi:MAG TPA: 3'-5' exonuclease, partial [Candidatus Limnocylindria bacterium]|nr:3'-5' exonuclease [Candidatus Limnocylindria bacterium]